MPEPTHTAPVLSVVIPAFNEQKYLPSTLLALNRAIRHVPVEVEIIVVDNQSTDRTAEIAAGAATVVQEAKPNIGAARNRGARAASGEYILFVDADVKVSEHALEIAWNVIAEQHLVAGGLGALYEPRHLITWMFCAYWDWRRLNGAPCQGVAQFFRKDLFVELGGYREDIYMGEDVDLYHRAENLVQSRGLPGVRWIRESVVWPSPRRLDARPIRTILQQLPNTPGWLFRYRWLWRDWRTGTIR
jgi:glycosyltransferase involved in cell wall biosynthesis